MTPERLEELKQLFPNTGIAQELIAALEEARTEMRRLRFIEQKYNTVVQETHPADGGQYRYDVVEAVKRDRRRAEQAEVLLKDRCADLDYEYNERLKAEAERDRLLRQKQAWQDAGEAMRVRAEKAEIDLAKMTANAEIERLGREEAAKAYEKAEAERDKLKGALDISEHRGLAYMEERDKLAARVAELEEALVPPRILDHLADFLLIYGDTGNDAEMLSTLILRNKAKLIRSLLEEK